MTLREVYCKYKPLDRIFLHSSAGDASREIIKELWQAIKEEVEKREAK